MGITIKELSEISGYSITTISRVITNKGNVKKETKEAVQKLLVQYNYRTNVMDFLKSEQSSKIIMVILGVLDNFYYSSLIKVIKEKTETYGYSVLIGYTDNSLEEEEKYVRMAIKEQYAGIFFMNVRGGNDLAELLKSGGVPVVFLNRGIRFAEFDSVTSDNYRGGYMITSYLIEMGHKKIGHLMGNTYSTVAQERRRGYEDAMNDAKLPVTRNSVHIGELNYESGYKYGEAIVKNLGSPKAMDRMTSYLMNVKPTTPELVVDEMLAIRSEIEAWRTKKDSEDANAKYNEMLYYGFGDD